jgi:hypothetical protein
LVEVSLSDVSQMFETRHARSRGSGKPGEPVSGENIDEGILPLVEALAAAGCRTWGSCEGHFSEEGGSMPYVSFEASPGVIDALQNALAEMWRTNTAKLPWSLRFSKRPTGGGSIWRLGVDVEDTEDESSHATNSWSDMEHAHLRALEHDVGVLAPCLRQLACSHAESVMNPRAQRIGE